MTFLYFAHIPFVVLFFVITLAFVLFNWRSKVVERRQSRTTSGSATARERTSRHP